MIGLDVVLYVGSLLFGLIIGSFLNVVAYRVPRKESLIRPGSRCPRCGHAVRWYDNVPVLGWLVLRGRCRDCGAAIPFRYAVVEGLTGLLFLAAALVMGWTPHLPLAWAFFAVLVAVSLIDLDHLIIPDKIVLPSAIVGLAVSILLTPSRWWQYLAAGLGAALFLFVVALIWPGGMGLGDVKLALLLGFVLGASVIVALFAAFLFGGVVGVLLLATGRRTRKDKIPFGPFLAGGGIIGSLAGTYVLSWYMGLIG